MSDRIDEIMQNYRNGIKEIDGKYEIKKMNIKRLKIKDTTELDEKIKYEEDFIKRLEFESKTKNKDMIEKSESRLANLIKEKNKIEEENKTNIEKNQEVDKANKKFKEDQQEYINTLRNRTVILKDGVEITPEERDILDKERLGNIEKGILSPIQYREISRKEKDELDKNDLKTKAIKELTQESKDISLKIQKYKLIIDATNIELKEFEYKYEEKEDGSKLITNGKDYRILSDKVSEFTGELLKLNKMQEKCSKYLDELKSKSAKQEKMEQVWKDAYKAEIENKQNQAGQSQGKDNQGQGQGKGNQGQGQGKDNQGQGQGKDNQGQGQGEDNQGQGQGKDNQGQGKGKDGQGQDPLEPVKIVLKVSENKIKVTGKEHDFYYKREEKNKKELKKKYNTDKFFSKNKSAKKYIDWSLLSILDKVDNRLAGDYLSIIKGDSSNYIDEYCLDELKERTIIEYEFNEKNMFTKLREKRCARKAHELGISYLSGISEKSVLTKFIDTITRKEQKLIEEQRKSNKEKLLAEHNERKSKNNLEKGNLDQYKVKNEKGEIEKNAQEQMKNEVKQIVKDAEEVIEDAQEIK